MKKSIVLIFAILLSLSLKAQWQKTNASFGGNINVLEVSGNNIFAGTDKGVYLSVDNGSSWTQMNNGLTNTIIYSMVVNGSNVFVGTAGNGVFLTSDNGANWNAVNNGMSNSDVRSLYFKGSNLFAGTENDGVFVSSDNGINWNSINNGLTNSPFRAFIEYNGSLYVGTFGAGLFKTLNNGNNWLPVISINNSDQNAKKTNALAVMNGRIYAGTEGGLYSLVENGSNSPWTAPTSWFPVKSLEVLGTKLYVGTLPGDPITFVQQGYTYYPPPGYPTGKYGILVSTDYAQTWSSLNNGLSYNQVNAIAFLGSSIFAGTFGTGIYISSNNGTSWTSKNKGIGNANVVSLINGNGTFYAGTDGAGIHKSTDGGNTWVEINNGMPEYKITALTISGTTLFAGTSKTGLFKSIDGGVNWISHQLISPLANGYGSGRAYPVNIYSLHTSANGQIYVSIWGNQSQGNEFHGLFSTTNLGVTWSQKGGFEPKSISTNGSFIFAGGNITVVQNGVGNHYDMAISNNNGFSWSYSRYSPSQSYSVDTKSIETFGANILTGTNPNNDMIGISTSSNNGASWNKSNFLPFEYNLSVNALSKYNNSVFAGTNYGLFYSSNYFSTSIKLNKDLLDTNITSLMIINSDIYAGTLNGTIWKVAISDIIQPPSPAGKISGLTSVCNGQESVIYTVPPINNAEFYIWKLPNGSIDTTSTNNISISFNSTEVSGNLTVYATNYFGDGQNSIQYITINTLPIVTLGTFNAVCVNSGLLNLQGGLPSGGNYSGISVNNNIFNTSIGNGPYSITYHYSDINGCSSNATQQLIVNALPIVVASASKTSICSGDNITLTGAGASSYIWDNNVSNGVSFIPTNSKTYTLTGTDANGCSKTVTIDITINQLPIVTVLANGPTTYCSNKLTELVASNGVSYLWNNGSITKSIKPTQSGSYFVKVTDINGCFASSDPVNLTVNDCASIDQLTFQSIQIFPNPTSSILSVEIPSEFINLTYKVMDLAGKELLKGNFNTATNSIDVRKFSSGTYLIELENGYRMKFIKQ